LAGPPVIFAPLERAAFFFFACHSEERSDEESPAKKPGILRCAQDDSKTAPRMTENTLRMAQMREFSVTTVTHRA